MYRNSLCSGRRLIHDEDDDKENANAKPPAVENDNTVPLETYLKEIREIEKGVKHSAEDQKAIESSDMSQAHQQRCQSTKVAFVTMLSEIRK